MLFLSKDPKEHHQIVLATGRQMETPSQFNQISFEVSSLQDLHENFSAIQDIAPGEAGQFISPIQKTIPLNFSPIPKRMHHRLPQFRWTWNNHSKH